MKKVNFDNLTNIEVPDSLIKSALNVPNDNPKRPFLPVRFHRFAAGIAACVVIAAAVTLSLMFGFHNDVDLTNPDSDSPSRSGLISNKNSPTSTPDVSEPSKAPSPHSGEAAQSDPAAAAEPGENSGGSSSPQSTAQTKGRTATQTPDSQKTDKSKKKPASSDPQSPADEPVVTEPEDVDPPQTEPEEQPPTEEPTNSSEEKPHRPSKDDCDVVLAACEFDNPEPGSSIPAGLQLNRYSFNTTIPSSYMVGNIFCLIENDKGQILGNGGLYSKNREVSAHSVDKDSVRLTFECYCIFYYGKTYTVNFYNSINGNFYCEI